jgi:hypothetical protein
MSPNEETVWCCTTERGSQLFIVDKKHHELKSFCRFWYQEIRDFLNSKHTVRYYYRAPGKLYTKLEQTHARNFLKEAVEHVLLTYPKPCVKRLLNTCLLKNL